MYRDRFAPSPTGYLHLGHAYSALTAWTNSQKADGDFLLRIEDLDHHRSKPEYVQAIFEDLEQLGICWEEPVIYQSERQVAYQKGLEELIRLGICYPCKCSRKDIRAALEAPQHQKGSSLKHATYPGTCRNRTMADMGTREAIRLNMARAVELLGGTAQFPRLAFQETGFRFHGKHTLEPESLIHEHGDFVVARNDVGASYHLAVVIDDAFSSITHVTRGEDIFKFTYIHRLLQELLHLPVPFWHHHKLIRDRSGKRLAKRSDSESLRALWSRGHSNDSIRAMLGLDDNLVGLTDF